MKKLIATLTLILCVAATMAQTDYNLRRRSLFETLPITSKNIVFLGNSITDGCEWNELFKNGKIVNRGISGDRSGWMLDRLDCIVEGQPKKLFLMIGINDLAAGVTPEELVGNITKIVDRFEAESPKTKIYLQSVLPVNGKNFKVYKNHYAQAADVIKTNKMLKKLVESRESDILYIDLYSLFADSEGNLKKELTGDGLHLRGNGYAIWHDAIAKYVK